MIFKLFIRVFERCVSWNSSANIVEVSHSVVQMGTWNYSVLLHGRVFQWALLQEHSCSPEGHPGVNNQQQVPEQWLTGLEQSGGPQAPARPVINFGKNTLGQWNGAGCAVGKNSGCFTTGWRKGLEGLHCDGLVLSRGCKGVGEGVNKGDKVIFPSCFLVGSYMSWIRPNIASYRNWQRWMTNFTHWRNKKNALGPRTIIMELKIAMLFFSLNVVRFGDVTV